MRALILRRRSLPLPSRLLLSPPPIPCCISGDRSGGKYFLNHSPPVFVGLPLFGPLWLISLGEKRIILIKRPFVACRFLGFPPLPSREDDDEECEERSEGATGGWLWEWPFGLLPLLAPGDREDVVCGG
ncbi:hypothetical protein K474DRAFT_1259754 [Panus rudis PR-1116 ss-1]|nr:hypothetical protein K474DRAFT_1259754 [Panus rudis PR-1116 ss-1]